MNHQEKTSDWLTVPGTQLKYSCTEDDYYFDYTTDPQKPSFYFTKNIKELVITCNENG